MMINVNYDFQNFISAQKKAFNKPVLPEMAANLCREFYITEGLAFSYSLKPFSAETLLKAVRRTLNTS